MATQPYYSVAEAARELGVNPSTIWRWIEAGKLAAVRVGPKNIRIRRQDLDTVIQQARTEPPRKASAMIGAPVSVDPPTREELVRRQALVKEILGQARAAGHLPSHQRRPGSQGATAGEAILWQAPLLARWSSMPRSP